jgi:hypothetical protein
VAWSRIRVELALAVAAALCVTGIVRPGAAAALQPQPTEATLDAVLERASAWVASFERELGVMVVEERLEQQARRPGDRIALRSVVRSDLLLLHRSAEGGWLPFRDVFEVDGRGVRDRDERLQKLFLEHPETALNEGARITRESSRYNLGSVIRTINVPTFALMFLEKSYAGRFRFSKRREEVIDGLSAWRVDFVERVRPTIVKTLRGDDVRVEGSLWIEPASGRVARTLVKTEGTADPGAPPLPFSGITMMWVDVRFGYGEPLGQWAPATLNEWGMSADLATVSGTATYSNLRRFAVDTDQTFRPSSCASPSCAGAAIPAASDRPR